MFRRDLVSGIITEKKKKLHEESLKVAEERFQEKDFSVGQDIYVYVDSRAVGLCKKEWIRWSGPFKCLEVRDLTVVLMRNGRKATLSKTKCIALRALEVPDRDVKGRAREGAASDAKQQDDLMKRKVADLAKKLKKRKKTVSDDEKTSEEDLFNDDVDPLEEEKLTLVKKRPVRKQAYAAGDLTKDALVVIWAYDTTRLAKYMFTHRPTGWSTDWIRCHLLGSEEKRTEKRSYLPIWKTGGKQDYLARTMRRASHAPFHVDVDYADIIYILKHRTIDGRIDPRDLKEMGYGKELQIFAYQAEW